MCKLRPPSGPSAWPAAPSRSFALTKWLVNRSLDADRATMAHDEAVAVELNTATHDAAEGVAAFQERRPPEWKGY